jgi:hypothetical protein
VVPASVADQITKFVPFEHIIQTFTHVNESKDTLKKAIKETVDSKADVKMRQAALFCELKKYAVMGIEDEISYKEVQEIIKQRFVLFESLWKAMYVANKLNYDEEQLKIFHNPDYKQHSKLFLCCCELSLWLCGWY